MPDDAEFIIIAVDPGVSGGIVWNEGGKTHAIKMPGTVDELVDLLQKFAMKSRLVEMHLEYPSKGGWGEAARS